MPGIDTTSFRVRSPQCRQKGHYSIRFFPDERRRRRQDENSIFCALRIRMSLALFVLWEREINGTFFSQNIIACPSNWSLMAIYSVAIIAGIGIFQQASVILFIFPNLSMFPTFSSFPKKLQSHLRYCFSHLESWVLHDSHHKVDKEIGPGRARGKPQDWITGKGNRKRVWAP